MKNVFNRNGRPNVNSVVLYNGPSMLDGKPIVVIASGFRAGSANEKTGSMIQTWILRADVKPNQATKTGADSSICGDCPHRHFTGGACYVLPFQAPRSVWEAWKRGNVPSVSCETAAKLVKGRALRLGSYGDPAAVPFEVWQPLAKSAAKFTGYTHQWRTADKRFQSLCMASVDNVVEAVTAHTSGWRYFRPRRENESKGKNEFVCPASAEKGYKTDCNTCNGCAGTSSKQRANVTLVVHGARKKRFKAKSEKN